MVIVLIAFSAIYLHFVVTHPTFLYETVPNNHAYDAHGLAKPTIDMHITLVGFDSASNRTCSQKIFPSMSSFGNFSYYVSSDDYSCMIRMQFVGNPAGGSVTITWDNPSALFPFYVQAIDYNLTAFYPNTSANMGWLSLMPPGVPSSDKGRSSLRGIILPGQNIIQGETTVQLLASYRPVLLCDESDTSIASSQFWSDPISLQDNGGMSCELTGASAKVYSISSVLPGVQSADSYWQANSSFSLIFTFQEGNLLSRTYVISAPAYGEVITVALLVVIGLYDLLHFFLHPLGCDSLAEYAIGSERTRWRSWWRWMVRSMIIGIWLRNPKTNTNSGRIMAM